MSAANFDTAIKETLEDVSEAMGWGFCEKICGMVQHRIVGHRPKGVLKFHTFRRSHANCDRNQVVFFLLGALTIVEIMDAHKGAAAACRGRASNGHEADGSCLVIKGISCERGHHCDEHVQKACVKVK